jgi:hypothetical protein
VKESSEPALLAQPSDAVLMLRLLP